MTEAEWLACEDPGTMWVFLREKAGDRKLRLFAAACCRLCCDFSSRETQVAVDTTERFADDQATEQDLSDARAPAHSAAWQAQAFSAAGRGPTEDDLRRLFFAAFMANVPERLRQDEMPLLRSDPLLSRFSLPLLRDIFGNPFRAARLDRGWLTPTMIGLGAVAYAEHGLPSGLLDPARLAVLADALEDAGCTDADLLGHLRSPGPHVLGCWALDLILGKE